MLLACACTPTDPSVTPTQTPLIAHTATTAASDLSAAPDPSTTDKPPTATPTSTVVSSARADLMIEAPQSLPIVPGEAISYSLAIRNLGPDPATDILLETTLPSGLTPVNLKADRTLCQRQGRSVRCKTGEVRSGADIAVTLDLSTDGSEPGNSGAALYGINTDELGWSCTIEQEAGSSGIVCHLPFLQADAEAELSLVLTAADTVTDPLQQMLTLSANETDVNLRNNQQEIMISVASESTAEEEGLGGGQVTNPPSTGLAVLADGPASVLAGEPYTYTYTITNQGAAAVNVRFEYALPPATELLAFAPALPPCQQEGNILTCELQANSGSETVTYTLIITGHDGQPVIMQPDPLLPGWPICSVLKERTDLHFLICELGDLKPEQATQVQMTLNAEGLFPRTLENTVTLYAQEQTLNPVHIVETHEVAVGVEADLEAVPVGTPQVTDDYLSYALAVRNNGPTDAAGVALTATLAVDEDLVTVASDQGDPCQVESKEAVGTTVTCPLGRLGSGNSTTVSIDILLTEMLLDSPWPMSSRIRLRLWRNNTIQIPATMR